MAGSKRWAAEAVKHDRAGLSGGAGQQQGGVMSQVCQQRGGVMSWTGGLGWLRGAVAQVVQGTSVQLRPCRLGLSDTWLLDEEMRDR